MISPATKFAMAYLDEAQPKDKPWTAGDARHWLETSIEREARAVRAALVAIGELQL